jgi:hypothetical protein
MTVGEFDGLDWALAPDAPYKTPRELTGFAGNFEPGRVLTAIAFLNCHVPSSNYLVICSRIRMRTEDVKRADR